MGGGLGWSIRNPMAHGQAPLTVELAGQWMHMPARQMSKVDPDDLVGDYSAGGSTVYLGISFRHEFYPSP